MLYLISGTLAGVVLSALIILLAMRGYMIKKIRIEAPFEEVCSRLEDAVKSVSGWGQPLPSWDFHATVSKTREFHTLSRKRIFFVCKAEYASRIVERYHHMGAMMPCTWSVYENQKGEVFIAKMNIGLMSKVFFGNIIGRTMSLVAGEETRILENLQGRLAAPDSQPLHGKAA